MTDLRSALVKVLEAGLIVTTISGDVVSKNENGVGYYCGIYGVPSFNTAAEAAEYFLKEVSNFE